jgi:hypothetical protein
MKNKVKIERAEHLTKEGIFAMSLSDKEYFIFCEGKKQGKQERDKEVMDLVEKCYNGEISFKQLKQALKQNV